jgi:hypothetical protein
LHAKSHAVPSHVAAAFAGGTHAVHDAPHVAVLLVLAQEPPHKW